MSTEALPGRETDLESFVEICQRMALVYLRKKIREGIFNPDMFGISPEELAVYATTPLFERDHEGRCVDLTDYFQRFLENGSSENTLCRVRQMTFSAVEEELSPYYPQYTTAEFKSLGNKICEAADTHPNVRVEDGSGCRWIVIHESQDTPTRYPRQMGQPVMPLKFLHIRLGGKLPANPSATEIIDELADMLLDHDVYRPAVPLPLLVKAIERIHGALDGSTVANGRDRSSQTTKQNNQSTSNE